MCGYRPETTAKLIAVGLLSPAGPGELSTQSEEFRTRWAAHNVPLHQTGANHIHHPVVGDLSLTFETMELRADTSLTILTYTAEPGSKSEEALNLLGSWAATLDQAEPANVTDEA